MILAFTRRSWEEMERDISFTLELPSYNVKKLMGCQQILMGIWILEVNPYRNSIRSHYWQYLYLYNIHIQTGIVSHEGQSFEMVVSVNCPEKSTEISRDDSFLYLCTINQIIR